MAKVSEGQRKESSAAGSKESHHFGNQGKDVGHVSESPLPTGSHTILVPIDGSSSSKVRELFNVRKGFKVLVFAASMHSSRTLAPGFNALVRSLNVTESK